MKCSLFNVLNFSLAEKSHMLRLLYLRKLFRMYISFMTKEVSTILKTSKKAYEVMFFDM